MTRGIALPKPSAGVTVALLSALGVAALCLLTAAGVLIVASNPADFPAAQGLPAWVFDTRTGAPPVAARNRANGVQQTRALSIRELVALHRAAVGALQLQASAGVCVPGRE